MPVEVPTECLPDVFKNGEACHLPYATSVNDQENAKDECSGHTHTSDIEENKLSGDLLRRSA